MDILLNTFTLQSFNFSDKPDPTAPSSTDLKIAKSSLIELAQQETLGFANDFEQPFYNILSYIADQDNSPLVFSDEKVFFENANNQQIFNLVSFLMSKGIISDTNTTQ